MINKQIKNNKGFTLVETMVAVFILTFTIAVMMNVVANGLFAARYARDEITANYLLQEVIDYIRNDRDTTVFLGNGAWNSFYPTSYSDCLSTNGCYFDVLTAITSINPLVADACDSDGCPNLCYDANADTTAFYVNEDTLGNCPGTGLVKTDFQRKIVVVQNGLDEVDVTVTVSWKNGSLDRKRELKTSFMNWQQ